MTDPSSAKPPGSPADSSAAGPSTDPTSGRLDRLEAQLATLYAVLKQRARLRAADFSPALQPAAFQTLAVVLQLGPANPKLLAEVLGFDRSVLSRQLHQLLQLGLVQRRPDPLDGRAAVISITDDARERLQRVTSEARDSFRDRLAGWRDDELDELARLLAKLSSDGVHEV